MKILSSGLRSTEDCAVYSTKDSQAFMNGFYPSNDGKSAGALLASRIWQPGGTPLFKLQD